MRLKIFQVSIKTANLLEFFFEIFFLNFITINCDAYSIKNKYKNKIPRCRNAAKI